jgi:hypothetical protein
MQLADYFKTIEPSEVIIGIISGCLATSIIYHTFKADSVISVFFGFLTSYGVIELRKSKNLVPTRLIHSKVDDLNEIVQNGTDNKNIRLKWLETQPEVLQSLHDCIEFGKNSIISFSEGIMFTNTFCNNLHDSMTLRNKDYEESLQKYDDSIAIVHEILNSIHSLVYVNGIDDLPKLEQRLYSLRNSIRNALKKTRRFLKIKDTGARASNGVSLPSAYDFF